MERKSYMPLPIYGNFTYKIQEYHLPVYHCLCLMLEEKFFGEK